MDWPQMLKIGAYVFVLVGSLVAFYQAGQALRAREQAFKDRGASWTLGLGMCLSGLPGLEQPAMVTCGGTASELLFLDDADNREICRLPWSAVQQVFGGNENETHLHLRAADGLPSLTLAQSNHLGENGKPYVPSYTVIDWTDETSRSHQAVFELREPRLGSFKANYLTVRRGTSV